MKIKTHSGEMVEARLRMLGTKLGVDGEWEIIDFIQDELRLRRDRRGFLSVTCFSKPEDFTLLHVPFEIGDDAEILDVQTGKWHLTKIDDEDLNMAKRHGSIFYDWLTKFRHANPSLRDSPDYKPEGLCLTCLR